MNNRLFEDYYNNPLKFDEKFFLRGVGKKYLVHPHFEKWFNYIIENYNPPNYKKIALFTVCSWGKPYSQSYIHYFIQKTLNDLETTKFNKIHQIIVSNCGIVPRELENFYPFCSYDWDPNFEWDEIKKEYSSILACRLKRYLDKQASKYDQMFCYLRYDSDSYDAIRIVEKNSNYKIPNLSLTEVSKDEIFEASLGNLYNDCDIILITKSNLSSLLEKLRKI